MDIDNINIELELAKKAAKEAGKLLLGNREVLNKPVGSSKKDTKLIADLKAENLIIDIVAEKSNYPILAEESGKSADELGNIFWVIDPLDGTANYNRGIPICCVSIGLVRDMKPILGVIYDFNNDDIYVGDKFSNISTMNDVPINVSNKETKEDSILITGLPHNSDYSKESLSKMVKDMQTWKKVRMIGSAAIAACYIASGKGDKYQEKGIYLWDIIAGAAIVESAGGNAEILNLKENFQVDVVFSNSKI
tara:strand:- start:869 stop:1618 length:750 start_codon:yes stop_codon:yes gene_type:complete